MEGEVIMKRKDVLFEVEVIWIVIYGSLVST